MSDQTSNIDLLHDAQIIDKNQLSDDLKDKLNGLSSHEVQTLIGVHAKIGGVDPQAMATGSKIFL